MEALVQRLLQTGVGSGHATVASLVKAIADPVANEQFYKYRHFY